MGSSALNGNCARCSWLRGVVSFSAVLASLTAMLILASPAFAESPPSIESVSVSHITEHDATLEATINPNGLNTTYQFRLESGCLPPMACVAITTYPLPSGELPSSSEPRSVSLDLNSAGVTLKPHTTYAYSVEATDEVGSTSGVEQRFTTPRLPLIESESVSHVTATEATLEAQINPNGLEPNMSFGWHSPTARTRPPKPLSANRSQCCGSARSEATGQLHRRIGEHQADPFAPRLLIHLLGSGNQFRRRSCRRTSTLLGAGQPPAHD
jgi:hypothetical protein